jgi:hypothetical protein
MFQKFMRPLAQGLAIIAMFSGAYICFVTVWGRGSF